MASGSQDLLSLEEIKPALLQDNFVSSYVEAATALLASSSNWPKGKTFHHGAVLTRSQAKSEKSHGLRWHMRESRHPEPYEWFRDGLFKDHSRHESQYIESCDQAIPLQVIHEGVAETFNVHYKMPPLTSNRDFAVLVITKETTEISETSVPARSFLVISIPIVHPPTPGYTRAKYVSVEECREEVSHDQHAEGEQPTRMVKWRMALKADAGGLVPSLFSELAMPSKVSEDVPSYMSWAKKQFGH